MDYQAFYSDVANWIIRTNQMAMQHGMNSDFFWKWVSSSSGELSCKYDNNPLVMKQMIMLYQWIEEFSDV